MAFAPGRDRFIPGGDHANHCLAWNKYMFPPRVTIHVWSLLQTFLGFIRVIFVKVRIKILKLCSHHQGGISSSVLSVFFTDKFALSQSDARISVAYNSCQWWQVSWNAPQVYTLVSGQLPTRTTPLQDNSPPCRYWSWRVILLIGIW